MTPRLAAYSSLFALPAVAQLKLPAVSQHASVTQTVGLTDITITYSRPGVKGRLTARLDALVQAAL